jgi:hypothetical protein
MNALSFCVTDWVWGTADSELHCAGDSVERTNATPSALSLPAAERRRMNPLSSFALRAGERLVRGRTTEQLKAVPMVFGSRDGDGAVLLRLLFALRDHQPVSPTQFHNSVHNASAGYWSIGLGGQAPTTALAAGEDTVEVALVEAGMQATDRRGPVMVVAASRVFPPELKCVRPDLDDFAFAAWCEPADDRREWRCTVSPASAGNDVNPCSLAAAVRAEGEKGLVGRRIVRRLAGVLEITRRPP